MKANKYFLNTALALVMAVACGAAVLVRTFAPNFIIPTLDVPNLVLVSLAALVLDHYVTGGAKRCWFCVPVLGAVTFGLLPWCACFLVVEEAIKMGIIGGIVFTVTTLLFTSMQDRISTGPMAKLAPLASALGLYLAVQCFAGMIL